jgi:hypothetical protein
MFNGILFIYFRTWLTVVDAIVPIVTVAIATVVVTAVEIPVVVTAVVLDTTMDIVFLCFVCFPIVVTAIQV